MDHWEPSRTGGPCPKSCPEVRFYQVDGGTTRRFGGMGIGLTAVRGIVEAHRGRLDIQSAVGRGTRVILRLPIVIPKG